MARYLSAAGEPPDDEEGKLGGASGPLDTELLPFRVEVWDAAGAMIEQVVALTKNRSVGWAAFYATKEQFPTRTVIFRDQFGELSRWNGKRH